MPERATVFETTQVGLEAAATPGTVVVAPKRLLAVSVEPKPMVPTVPQRNLGSKFVNQTFNKKEWTQADMKGIGCFQTLPYLLNCILTGVTPSTPGGGTNSRLWSYTPNTYSPDAPSTLTVESGSSAGAERFPFACLDSLAMRFTKDDVGISGTWFGQALVEGATLTPGANETYKVDVGDSSGGTFTLTKGANTTSAQAFNVLAATLQSQLEGLASIGAGNVTVTGTGPTADPYVITFKGTLSATAITLTGSGASLSGGAHTLTIAEYELGTTTPVDITPVLIDPTMWQVSLSPDGSSYTLLNRCFEAEFAINNRFSQVMTLDDSKSSYSAVVEKMVGLSAMLCIEHDTVGAGFMTQLRAKTDYWCRLLATGPLIEGSLHYLMQIDFPFHFKDNTRADKSDVWSSTYHLEPIYKASWNGGAALKIQVQNVLKHL